MKTLRRLFLQWFPQYESLETMFVTYHEAGEMIRASASLPETSQWVICRRFEDHNQLTGYVWLERRKRITE